MKYKYKILFTDSLGNPGAIGVNAGSMIEAAEMAEAIRVGMPEISVINSIKDMTAEKGANHE